MPTFDIYDTEAMLQGMRESAPLVPHTSSLQDVLAAWHALKALPSQVDAIKQYSSQQLMQLRTNRELMLSSADAKADLVGCLEAVAGSDQGSQAVTHAMQKCMLSASHELQVSSQSKGVSAQLHVVCDCTVPPCRHGVCLYMQSVAGLPMIGTLAQSQSTSQCKHTK